VHTSPPYILAHDHALIRADGRSFERLTAACLARSCCGVVDASAARAAFRGGSDTMPNVSQNTTKMAGVARGGVRGARPLFGIGHSRYCSTIFCHPGSVILAPSAHHSVEDECSQNAAISSFTINKRLGACAVQLLQHRTVHIYPSLHAASILDTNRLPV
jgi:hypothetical protein